MPEIISKYRALYQHIRHNVDSSDGPFLIGIAGPPATGKSTLAERLVNDLNASGVQSNYCPMDGFHFSNRQLEQFGSKHLKGHIDTFNASKFVESVQQLKARGTFWWPLYSRQIHDPVPEGVKIRGTEKVYIIEGNYVLDSNEPWRSAALMLELSIFVDVPDALLRERLEQRHRKSGRTVKEALKKIENIDMPNARYVRSHHLEADVHFRANYNDF